MPQTKSEKHKWESGDFNLGLFQFSIESEKEKVLLSPVGFSSFNFFLPELELFMKVNKLLRPQKSVAAATAGAINKILTSMRKKTSKRKSRQCRREAKALLER